MASARRWSPSLLFIAVVGVAVLVTGNTRGVWYAAGNVVAGLVLCGILRGTRRGQNGSPSVARVVAAAFAFVLMGFTLWMLSAPGSSQSTGDSSNERIARCVNAVLGPGDRTAPMSDQQQRAVITKCHLGGP